jgi:DNA mismatch repair protein MutL
MKKINELSLAVANQIAAGEVVEKPVSVVKELVENSLDALASTIEVRIKNGGLDLIVVADNGHGIDESEMPLAIKRYATSKLSTVSDLDNIATFGFRGEAMAAIAAVSQTAIISRTAAIPHGVKAMVEAGHIVEMGKAGAEVGTRIEVRNLFYNVPARLKFQKSKRSQASEIEKLIRALAFAHENVSWRYICDDKSLINLPSGPDNLLTRAELLLGPATKGHLYAFEEKSHLISLAGVIAAPAAAARDGRHIYIYVNDRLVNDRKIIQAVYAAFRTLLEVGCHPVCAIKITLPPGEVDVNTHPRKAEVRFADEHKVLSHIISLLSGFLSQTVWQQNNAGSPLPSSSRAFASDPYGALMGSYDAPPRSATESRAEYSVPLLPETALKHADGEKNESRSTTRNLRVLGQAHSTFLMLEHPQGLVIIDQHAAHERVVFERLRAAGGHFTANQPLLFPLSINLDREQMELLPETLPHIRRLGIDAEIFGEHAVVIRAVPSFLNRHNLPQLLIELIEDFAATGRSDTGVKVLDHMLATLACHSSVRAGQKLNPEEISALLDELDDIDFSGHCPHGRPVAKWIPQTEIKKWFDRP